MKRFFSSTPARFALWGGGLFLAVSTLTRAALLAKAGHDVSWNSSLAGALGIGFLFDICCAVFAALPWLLAGALLPDRFWHHKAGRAAAAVGTSVFAVLLVFIAVSEWVFWDEFGARFNFIAVDYLVWTQEVWGNIRESYPMVPILGGIALIGAACGWGATRAGVIRRICAGGATWIQRVLWPVAGLAAAAAIVWGVRQSDIPAFRNQFNGELARNGCWSFFAAFRHMELDYKKWYPVLPDDEAVGEAKRMLSNADEPAASPDPEDLTRGISGRGDEKRWNVITICMESMSGSYMSYLGNTEGLTPNLDQIATESLFFENLYATGTRTVRGMEALTLTLPPTPGQAIIYRPEGTDLTTTFTPFLDRGYDCAFFYGGDGRFDFMNRYFSTAGCRMMDKNAWNKDDVTFETAWGACDEDLFHKTIIEADRNHLAGKPFHFFCMTTSNHRPYDFPDGRIDLPSHHGRKPAVKYADWAVGHLLAEASRHAWFKDTLFVICADHCASSAGRMELDVTKYHIPAMIFNPQLVPPRTVNTLCSQIDVMPTVFGLMGWSYESLGYGHDLLAPGAATRPGRAFVSNYQKIALLTDDRIAILKPNRQVTVAGCDLETGALTPLDPAAEAPLVRDTTAFYQSASWLFGSGRLKRQPAVPSLSQR